MLKFEPSQLLEVEESILKDKTKLDAEAQLLYNGWFVENEGGETE